MFPGGEFDRIGCRGCVSEVVIQNRDGGDESDVLGARSLVTWCGFSDLPRVAHGVHGHDRKGMAG